MALAHEIDQEKFDKYSESIQSEYEKVGEKYFLQTTGLVPKAKNDEFRENNIKLRVENERLSERASILGDMTQKEFDALKNKATGGKLSDEEKEALVESEVGKRIVKLNEENTKTVNDLNAKLTNSNSELSKVLIDTELKTIGIELGVKTGAIMDFITRGRQVFKMVDGKPTPLDGVDVLFGKDGLTPLTMAEWSAELITEAPHLFKKSEGTGDRHRKPSSGAASGNNVRGMRRMQGTQR